MRLASVAHLSESLFYHCRYFNNPNCLTAALSRRHEGLQSVLRSVRARGYRDLHRYRGQVEEPDEYTIKGRCCLHTPAASTSMQRRSGTPGGLPRARPTLLPAPHTRRGNGPEGPGQPQPHTAERRCSPGDQQVAPQHRSRRRAGPGWAPGPHSFGSFCPCNERRRVFTSL